MGDQYAHFLDITYGVTNLYPVRGELLLKLLWELMNPSAVSLPTEFIQLDWRFGHSTSNFSQRTIAKRAMDEGAHLFLRSSFSVQHLSPNLASLHLHTYLTL